MSTIYDPRRRKVDIRISRYAVAHEQAHAAQHAEETLLWRWFAATRRIPVLCRVTALLLEIDAAARALALMPGDDDAKEQAGVGVLSYALAVTMLPVLLGWTLAIFARKAKP